MKERDAIPFEAREQSCQAVTSGLLVPLTPARYDLTRCICRVRFPFPFASLRSPNARPFAHGLGISRKVISLSLPVRSKRALSHWETFA